jgi:hypothetical protein
MSRTSRLGFPPLLHGWLVRPLRGEPDDRLFVLSRTRSAPRVLGQLLRSRDLEVEEAFDYTLRRPARHLSPHNCCFYSCTGADHQLMLTKRPLPAEDILWRSFLPGHAPCTRVVYLESFPASGVIVRADRLLDARTREPYPDPPLWMLNLAQTLQRALVWRRRPHNSHEASLRTYADDLHRYYRRYGHCNVPQRDPEWRRLGKALSNMRRTASYSERTARFEALCHELDPALTLWDTQTPVAHLPSASARRDEPTG